MMRVVGAVAVTLAMLCAAPAMAAVNLAKVPCDSKEAKEIMLKLMQSAQIEDGYSLSGVGVSVEAITKASTVTASKSKLICKVRVRVRYQGQPDNLTGLFTLTVYGGDRLGATWQPQR